MGLGVTCQKCKGAGVDDGHNCDECAGTGFVPTFGRLPVSDSNQPKPPAVFSSRDVRVAVEVECFPVVDDDAALAIAVRGTEDRLGAGVWLSAVEGRRLAGYINEVLTGV